MNQPQTPPNQKNKQPPIQTLVLDSNVVLSCLSTTKDKAEKSKEMLKAFLASNYLLAINEITFYECFKHLNPSRAKDFNDFLGIFKPYSIDLKCLALAADLCSFYRAHPQIKNHMSMSTEDTLIASTSMLTGGCVLTTDVYDFPAPFFRTLFQHNMVYDDDKGVKKLTNFYFLQADYTVFTDARDEWYKTKAPNANQAQLRV